MAFACIHPERGMIQNTMIDFKKIRNTAATVLAAITVILALLLVVLRLSGLRAVTVPSSAVEPAYPAGSLIFVKDADPAELKEGDRITFFLDEDTVETRRITGVEPDGDDPAVIRCRTGDGPLVHSQNIIGIPVFSIPVLGYGADFLRTPPGLYLAMACGVILLGLVFLSEYFCGEKDAKRNPRRNAQGGKYLKR